jgi:hypothetical protein
MGAMTRREFLGTVPAAGWLAQASAGAAVRLSPAAGIRLEPFDYRHPDAAGALEKITDFARRTFSRENRLADPSHNQHYYGLPQEWYTLAENLYRASELADALQGKRILRRPGSLRCSEGRGETRRYQERGKEQLRKA